MERNLVQCQYTTSGKKNESSPYYIKVSPEMHSTYNMAFRFVSDIAWLTRIAETRAHGKEGEWSSSDAKISNLICDVNYSVKEDTKIPLTRCRKGSEIRTICFKHGSDTCLTLYTYRMRYLRQCEIFPCRVSCLCI